MDLQHFFQQILAWLSTTFPGGWDFWIYVILMLAVMVEGPFAILFASTVASAGFLQPGYVFISASLGNLVGDILWYSLGYFSRFDWISRLQRFTKTDPDRLAALAKVMRDQAVKILIIAKLTNGLIVPTLITTGIIKVPLRKWFPFIFVANAVVTGTFVAFGYFMASNLMKVQEGVRYVAAASSILMFLGITWFIRRTLQKKFIEKTLQSTVNKDPLNEQQV